MEKIIHRELSYKLTGLCFKIQKELGRFCREKQYSDKLEELLKIERLNYKREFEIKNLLPGSPIGNKVDFLIDNKIIVDLKAKNFITKNDYFQMQRYLQAANLELGLIINFRESHLKPKRVLNSKFDSGHSDSHSEHSDRATGFTLLEIIIVIGLLAATIAVFSASISSTALLQKSALRARAASLIEEEIAALKSLPFAELTPRTNERFLGVLYNQGGWLITNTAPAASLPNALYLNTPVQPKYGSFTGILNIPAGAANDFTLSAKIKIPTGAAPLWRAGFIFRARDLENHYRVMLESDKLKIEKEQSGVTAQISSDNVTVAPDTWYKLEVRAASSTITTYLNDVLIRAAADTSFDFGKIALAAATTATPYFDDIVLAGPATSTWNFDAYSAGGLPALWKKFGVYDLKNGIDFLTISNYLGQSNLKQLTAEINWTEGTVTSTASSTTLIAE